MSDIDKMNEFELIDLLALEYGISGKESQEERNLDVLYQRRVLRAALEQKGALERVRERVVTESFCGVMRSMPMTDRANAMKDVLGFIDQELSGVESD